MAKYNIRNPNTGRFAKQAEVEAIFAKEVRFIGEQIRNSRNTQIQQSEPERQYDYEALRNWSVANTARATDWVVTAEIAGSLAEVLETGIGGLLGQIADAAVNAMNSRRGMAAANHEISVHMQKAVLDSYDQNVEARKKFDSYRVGRPNRLSGGVLRRALAEPGMVSSDSNSISFGDKGILDKEAAHWRRLNFGAEPNSGPDAQTVPIRLAGTTLAEWSIDDAPSAGFSMPRGFWSDGGRIQAGFYPKDSDPNYKETDGIQARRFMDAALVSFAENFAEVYPRVFESWFEED